jgi:HAMP domain-containing protein
VALIQDPCNNRDTVMDLGIVIMVAMVADTLEAGLGPMEDMAQEVRARKVMGEVTRRLTKGSMLVLAGALFKMVTWVTLEEAMAPVVQAIVPLGVHQPLNYRHLPDLLLISRRLSRCFNKL